MVLENGKIINLMKSKILPIAGDASFRTFYRLVSNKSSKIIVFAKKEKYKNLLIAGYITKFLYFSFFAKIIILLLLFMSSL